jgi:hypothetical protein
MHLINFMMKQLPLEESGPPLSESTFATEAGSWSIQSLGSYTNKLYKNLALTNATTALTKALFTFHPNSKYFLFHPSHQIFRRMHGALNVGKKDN